ncbi:MAG: dUTP diphosphatase [Acidimicrobiia bacterium]
MKIPVLPSTAMYQPPQFAHTGDAGADLTAAIDLVLEPGHRSLIPTGLSIAIPDGYAGLVLPRSGLAVKHGVTVVNSPGLIDSGYRGEVKVGLINHGDEPFAITRGDRIAQLLVTAVPEVEFVLVETLDETERGDGGFGSTGVDS